MVNPLMVATNINKKTLVRKCFNGKFNFFLAQKLPSSVNKMKAFILCGHVFLTALVLVVAVADNSRTERKLSLKAFFILI